MTTHGSDAYLAIDDSAGTLRVISTNVNNTDFTVSTDIHDDTTYGQNGHTKKGGLTDGSISIQGFWDKTALTGSETVLASLVGIFDPVDFEFGPEGNASGKVKKSGKFVLETYTQSAPVADLIAFTATLQISGTVTTGTFSA